MSCCLFSGIGFLGFNLDTFMNTVYAGGDTNSPILPHLTQSQQDELDAYIQLKGYRLLIKPTPIGPFLSAPTATHKSVGGAVSYQIQTHNITISGNNSLPMRMGGTARTTVNGLSYLPDTRFQVKNRLHDSPNFVLETHYRSSETVGDFHTRLTSYISNTVDIMVALGIIVYNRDQNGLFAAVAVVYERNNNAAVLTHNASFGTRAMDPEYLVVWNAATGQATLHGVGVLGFPPCDDQTQFQVPYVLPLPQDLMLAINFGPPFLFNHGQQPNNVAFGLSLYNVQIHVSDSFDA